GALEMTQRVKWVMDSNPATAEKVAGRCGALATSSEDDVISDERVEIVAICSPNEFHARQLIECCRVGKKVVLCEKPLAVHKHEVAAIRAAATASGTKIVVGTMHAFDPAYQRAFAQWQAIGSETLAV